MKRTSLPSPGSALALLVVAVLLVAAPRAAYAQLPPVNASPNKVGSGARAVGMGSAFVAVADDATAASWNPAGLTQLQAPEISVVYNWNFVSEDYKSHWYDEFDGPEEYRFDDINYASIAYPLPFTLGGRNMVVSLNYQRKFDFDTDLNFTRRDVTGDTTGFSSTNVFRKTEIHFEQEGGLSTLSPAIAMEVTPKLSVGITMNIWDQSLIPSNEWKSRNRFDRSLRTSVPANGNIGRLRNSFGWLNKEYTDFEGTNYTVGFLYRATRRLTIGGVYNSKLHADVKYNEDFIAFSYAPMAGPLFTRFEDDRRWEFPSSWSLGLAYRFPNDKLTLSADVTRTNWDEFVEIGRAGDPTVLTGFATNALRAASAAQRTSPITGELKNISQHDPTYTIRIGGEYVFFDETKPLKRILPSIRMGAFYDPLPSGGRKNSRLLLDRPRQGSGEVEDQFGVTFGLGVLIKNQINIDFAYEYRWADDVRTDTLARYNVDADTDQHRFFLSTVIYF